ncbi:hypothetical protein K490DRAFT_61268 [Saccharata proteae CBS 121410]|uniref:Rhodopsin domain-containing protein n=1 Tax=Saccharata proteae CBS 121410 TaxID=1314787 RepID=A0A9P4M3G5_9PEZI|nr:hypothetical protein K490DRAFT_61268 [Saccharata proteae CBS 121410]
MLYDAGISLFVAVLVLFPPAVLVFFMRVYVRYFRHVWGLDDWLMALAMPFFCWLAACCVMGAYDGLGWHSNRLVDFTTVQRTKILKDWFAFELSYVISVGFIKLSIAYMLVRVARPQRVYMYSFYAVMGLFTLNVVGTLIYLFADCRPLRTAWDPNTPGGHCASSRVLMVISYTFSSINIATDWACVLIPIPLISCLQMHRSSKIAAWLLLSAGSIASVCALVRLAKYTRALDDTEDILFHYGQFIVWAWAETAVGMFAACCGTLRPLLHRLPCINTHPSTSPSISFPTPLQRLVHHAQKPSHNHPLHHSSHNSDTGTLPSRHPTFPSTANPPASPFDDPLRRGQSNAETRIEGGVVSAMTWEKDLEREGHWTREGRGRGRGDGHEGADADAGVRINHHFEAISQRVTPEIRAEEEGGISGR